MNIAYATDNNYAPYAVVSMWSLLDNAKIAKDITVYIIDNGIEQKNKERFIDIANQYGASIVFILIDTLIKGLLTDGKFSITSYSRLFLTRLSNIDKIIYLDCDTAVCQDLQDFWNTNLEEYCIAGALDYVPKRYRKSINLEKEDLYINAGVLLMDLKKMRGMKWDDKVLDFINSYNGSVPHHDQGVINGVLNGKIKIVSSQYDVMDDYYIFSSKQANKMACWKKEFYTQEEYNMASKEPIIIHYTAGYCGRVWDKKCIHPAKEYFRKYMDMMPDVLQYADKKESRNVVIMRKIRDKFPFAIFYCVFRLKEFLKTIKKEYRRKK